MRRWEFPPLLLALLLKLQVLMVKMLVRTPRSTTNIVLLLSSVKKQFDTKEENNQHLDFVDSYNPALREFFSFIN